jgi:hypothetical protein
MQWVPFGFLVAALVLFILAAVQQPPAPRWNLTAAGLACWVVATILVWGARLPHAP